MKISVIVALLPCLYPFTDVDAVQLTYLPKPGSSLTLKTSVAAAAIAQVPAMDESMKMQVRGTVTFQQRVTRADENEFIEITTQVQSGHLTMTSDGEEERLAPPHDKTVVRMTAHGKIMSIQSTLGSDLSNADDPFGTMLGVDSGTLRAQGLMFPKGDVKVGDSWKEECIVDRGDKKSITIRCSARLLDIVEVLGYRCAKIHATLWTPLDTNQFAEEVSGSDEASVEVSGYTKNDITVYFAVDIGSPVYVEGAVISLSEISAALPAELADAAGIGDDMSVSTRLKMNFNTVLQKGVQ